MAFGLAMVGLDHWYTAFGVCDIAHASSMISLIGIADPDDAHRTTASEKWPETPVMASADALISDPSVDLVAICAPTGKAPAIAMAALAAGKHVLCVKPSARTLGELDEVLDTASRAGRFFGSFEGMQRLHPRNLLLRELISGGAIGMPMSFHQVGHGGLPSPWPKEPGGAPSWWIDHTLVPGGAWIDHAIYAIDLARFVLNGEIDAAAGIIENRVHHHLALEDYGMAILRLRRDGDAPSVALMLEDTWTAEPGGGAHRAQWIGTRGHLRPDGDGWIVTSNGSETRHDASEAPFFPLDALVDGLTAGAALPFGPGDARANLAACLLVYSSALP